MSHALKFASLVAGCLVMTGPGLAQDQADTNPAPGEAMEFLVGSWQGTGWSARPDGTRESFDIFERVETAAGGRVVLLRGEGFSPMGGGRSGRNIHDASGVVSRTEDGYVMYAATAQGGPTIYDFEVDGASYAWSIDLGERGRVEFEASVEDGVWRETGQYCAPAGPCYPTLYMELTRVAAD